MFTVFRKKTNEYYNPSENPAHTASHIGTLAIVYRFDYCDRHFFSAFNPRNLIPYNLDVDISPLAACSVGFFIFWILALVSSYGTLYFTISNCRFLQKQNK